MIIMHIIPSRDTFVLVLVMQLMSNCILVILHNSLFIHYVLFIFFLQMEASNVIDFDVSDSIHSIPSNQKMQHNEIKKTHK